MVKQKNDTLESQRKRAKRLKITAALLIVAALGLGAVFLSSIGNKAFTPRDGVFPYKVPADTYFCVPRSDDGSYALAAALSIKSLNPALYRVELYIDGVQTSDDDIEMQRMGSTGHLTTWCYSPGLAQGVYQMEFQLKDLQDQLIGAYQWTLTVTP